MTLQTEELEPHIGSQVVIDREALLGGAYAAQILALLEQRGVLLFRGLAIDDAAQIAFTRTLGSLGDDDVGTIYKVSFDKRENPTHADYNYGNFSWHIDRADIDVPPYASMLNAKRLAPSGGDTEFANLYAAYADLPEGDKRLIDRLQVVHRTENAILRAYPDAPPKLRQLWAARPSRTHPFVWRHRSGRKSLITGLTGVSVVGMGQAKGDALLARMLAWATQPRYVYRHSWQVGDLVIWNNTGTMHRVCPYDITAGRLLHRTVIAGSEPFDTTRAPVEA